MTNPVRKGLFVTGAAVLTALLAAPAVMADDTLSRSLSFEPGQRLEVDTQRGSIEYRPSGSTGLSVTVTCEDGRIADYLDVAIENTPDGARITARKTGNGRGGGWLSGLFGGNSANIRFLIEGPERVELALRTAGGHVTLGDIEGNSVVSTSGGHITFADIRGRLEAATSGGHIRGGRLTEGGVLKTSGGHISMDGAGGDLDVGTSGGHIQLGPVDGDLKAHTSGGNIEVDHVSGSMELSTSGGDVTAEAGCDGDADVSSSGGDIVLGGMGGHVKARTSGGAMRLSVADGNGAGADLSTSGGSIDVRIPSGIGFDIDAVANGAAVIAKVGRLEVRGETRKDRLRATVAGGGSTLRLRSDDGDIRISDDGGI